MRPLLIEITVSLPVAIVVTAIAILWCAVMLRRAGAMSWNDAFRRGVESVLTFGSKGSTEKTDISVPGSLGTIAVALGVYGLVKTPVHLPVFGYAAMAFCGFAATSLAGWITGPRLGVPPQTAIRVAFLCAFFGILGSRLFFVVQFWDADFADQPARVKLGRLKPPSGTTLEVQTAKGVSRVVFTGDEKTMSDVVARMKPFESAGVRAKVIADDRHIGDKLEVIERGITIETEERGKKAQLLLAGSALPDAVGAEGYSVPWTEVFAIWHGGLVYYGGMIFGTAAVLVFVRLQGQRTAQIADLASSVGALGIAFGRVGCFLNGCCWGRRAEVPWSIHFPIGSPAWLQHVRAILGADMDQKIGERQVGTDLHIHPDVYAALQKAGGDAAQLCHASWSLHPVQIYAILLDLGMFAVLFPFVLYKVKREWQTLSLWFIVYGVVRFVIEHFRGDHEGFVPIFGYPLTPSQRASLITLPFAIAGFIWASKKGRPIVPWKPPASGSPPAAPSKP